MENGKENGNFFKRLLRGNWISEGNRKLALVGAGAVFVMVLNVNYEVVARYVFNKPTMWSFEITEGLLVYATFLAFGYALTTDSHVRVEALFRFMPRKLLNIFEIFASFVILVFCTVLTWQVTSEAVRGIITGERSDSPLGLPMWPIYIVMPVGALFISLQALKRLISFIRRVGEGGGMEQEEKAPVYDVG
jgi:TRAP-type C4-dicarboxylate transport system permease small subunit